MTVKRFRMLIITSHISAVRLNHTGFAAGNQRNELNEGKSSFLVRFSTNQ